MAAALLLTVAPLAGGAVAAEAAVGPARAAPGAARFVDTHAHLDATRPAEAVQGALRRMPDEGATRILFMPPPFTRDDRERYEAEVLLSAVRGHAGQLGALGGGGSLNPMIHEAVRTGAVGPDLLRRFRQRAEQLLREGAVGFGEMAAEHFQGATPYQSAPPDHPLFLLLAEIAGDHGVPIVLHMEAVPRAMPPPAGVTMPSGVRELRPNVEALERLLAHDPRARIIWAHAGWDATGARTPDLCRRLLIAHPNLYMDLKVDPSSPGRNPLLTGGGSGPVDPAWLQLLREFPDRFVVGTDQHYPEPRAATQRWQAVAHLLEALPASLRERIAFQNPSRLYPPPPPGR